MFLDTNQTLKKNLEAKLKIFPTWNKSIILYKIRNKSYYSASAVGLQNPKIKSGLTRGLYPTSADSELYWVELETLKGCCRELKSKDVIFPSSGWVLP